MSPVTVTLSPDELGALVRAVEYARDMLETAGVRDTLHKAGYPRGSSPLELAHLRLLRAQELAETPR